jgi:NADPH:quinone reductase-like Zn-dependent oxidoreductase
MRAVWISRHGGPEVLELRESPDKVPIAGEVRIRAAACGMNFAELMTRQGLYPDAPKAPCVVGYEAAGTIDAVGAGVDRGSSASVWSCSLVSALTLIKSACRRRMLFRSLTK